MALHQGEGGHIPLDAAHPPHHRQGADVHKLVNAEHTADNSPISDDHMAGHGDPIGNHDPIAQLTVVAQMGVSHKQVATAQAGLLVASGGAVDGDALSDGVVIAQHHLGGIAGVLEVLGL